ncbi:MAG: MBOAT family protein [Lachnospiraceae bacterium]|nr:MBOAT family protein [Lachnospiraceae bacterium]
MLFNSLAFGVFLPLVFLLHWAIPHKYRWGILLVASYYFYMSWNPKYVILILLTTVASYLCAIMVDKTDDKRKKKLYLVITLIVSLGVLFFFKYFNFLSVSVTSALQSIAIPLQPLTLKIMLPVGISFYTFQSLSYVIDVYRGNVKPQKNFGKYALFISFFPQLVAGPIERTQNLMPQLFEERKFDHDQAVYGLRLMLLGFFKKLIIADSVSKYVDMVYNDVHSYFGLTFIVATILFTFQIYCDFSGYSDIAIGTSKLLGINLMTNFKSPYLSQSVKEFWGRWHISLSSWFKDYVYIPLGGNRVKKSRARLNIMLTFLASGLWHGANWTFLIWGGLHGIYQVIENLFPRKKGFMRGLLTFALVCFAWIFFRANTVSDAFYVVTHLHRGLIHFGNSVVKMLIDMQFTYFSFAKLAGSLLVLMVYDYFSLKKDLIIEFGKVKWPLRWIFYIGLTSLIIVLKLHNGTSQEFIYFQF